MLPTYTCVNLQEKLKNAEAYLNLAKKSTTTTAQQLIDFQNKYNKALADYNNAECFESVEKQNCLKIQQSVESLLSTIQTQSVLAMSDYRINPTLAANKSNLEKLKKQFEESECAKYINELYGDNIQNIIKKYSLLDEQRIQAENKHLIQKRLFFGALLIVSSFVIIFNLKKSKS